MHLPKCTCAVMPDKDCEVHATLNQNQLDEILDEALGVLSPVIKPKDGTGIMRMDSCRLLLKTALSAYVEKVAEQKIRELSNRTAIQAGEMIAQLKPSSQTGGYRLRQKE